jgi:hypothetical protein
MNMKKLKSAAFLLALTGMFLKVNTANAQRYSVDKQPPARPTEIRDMQFGAGLATSTAIMHSATALSSWVTLDHSHHIQGYFSVPGTSGRFQFALGGIYKTIIVGTLRNGFHVGGGLALGVPSYSFGGMDFDFESGEAKTKTPFFFNLIGNAGIHFTLPGVDHILVNLDAGPVLSVIDGNVDFSISGYSPLLGISVHYLF